MDCKKGDLMDCLARRGRGRPGIGVYWSVKSRGGGYGL